MSASALPAPTDLTAARRIRAGLARRDPGVFAEYVLRDEATGGPVELAPMHREWFHLIREHKRLVILAHVESGKTQAITVARTLYELGRNPNTRGAVVSNTHDQARRILSSVTKYIEESRALPEVFALRPGDPWRDDAITVQRPSMAKDPSLRAYGRHGPVTGARIDWLVIDDLDDHESTRTPEQRDETSRWVFSSLLGRLTADAQVIVLATAFHPDDFAHRLEKNGWPTYRFAVDDGARAPSWPERWPVSRIAAKRHELGPFESARQLDVTPINDSDRRLRQEWIEAALNRGDGMYRADGLFPHALLNRRTDGRVILGVDLGVGLGARHDLTALVVIFARDDGRRELLDVEVGRWELAGIIRRIEEITQRYRVSIAVVEAVAAQAWALQFLDRLELKVIPYRTNGGALSLPNQAEAMGVELAHGLWSFPSVNGRVVPENTELRELVRDMLRFSPTEHTPDRLAALLFARWAAAEEIGLARAETGCIDW